MIKNKFNFNFSFSKTVKTFFLALLGVMVISVPELKAGNKARVQVDGGSWTEKATAVDAFTAAVGATSSATIELLEDDDASGQLYRSATSASAKTITLDLKGHSLGKTSGAQVQLIYVNDPNLTLVIKDSSGGGRLWSSSGVTPTSAFHVIRVPAGAVELQSGSIDGATGNSQVVYGVRSTGTGKFTMTGGSIQTTACSGKAINKFSR